MMKKLISSILTVTILASCITFSNNKSTVKADSTTTNSSKIQIRDEGKLNLVEEDKVTTYKTIDGTDVENQFEITLEVTTEEDLKNIKISPDAATVLVLDTSGSMAEKDGDSNSRLKEMKSAAITFLTEYAKVESGSNAKRLVSIVSFASNVNNKTYYNGRNNWIDVTKSLSDAQALINNINWPDGGTNIEGGLIMANNIVNDGKTNKTLEGIENVNIILLTDGCPTFHVNGSNSDSISTIQGERGGGTFSKITDWKPVGGTVNNVSANSNNISNKIKGSGINLYTIAFSTSSSTFCYGEEDKDNILLNPSDWMSGFATRNFSAKDVNELTKQFEAINELIRLSAKAWKVTDHMGSNIIYKEITDSRKDNAYNFNNNILSWDIKNSNPTVSTTNEGNKKYTYTLKYNVILDTTNKDFNYKEVLTNGETILDYYLFSTDNSSTLKHASFNVPKVEGLFGSFNFTKVDEKNMGMPKVLFTLSGTATGSNKPVEMEVTSDVNGKVAFSNIPAGEYTLTETTPSGYVGAGPWNVKVSYGNTTKDTTLGDTIVNYPTSRSISVTKSWEGLTNGQSTPENVTVRLYKNNELTDRTLVLNSRNNWTDSFTNLPYIDGNGVINYSVKEDKVVGYDVAISRSEDGSEFAITNTYKPELLKIEGVKTWVDKSGAEIEGVVPDIEITLQRTLADNWDDESNIENINTITLTNGNTEYTFENLPKTATNSKEYKYRVRESKINGYEPTYNDEFDITNTYTPGNTELVVNKLWENVNIEKDTLPEVKAILYQDGIEYRSEVLNKVNEYSYTFTDLPKYAKTGVEYQYTVQEVLKEGTVGYTSSNSGNVNGVVTVTNTFDTTKINVTGQKQWVGISSGDQVPSVTLRLYQNGKAIEGAVITLKAGVKSSESYSFKNLPKYSTDGKLYTYTVVEDTIPGYTSSGEANVNNNFVITNTFTPETVNIIGDKTWSNVEDTSKVPTITIYLESSLDGTNWTRVEGKFKELPAGTTHYEFNNLPKYASDSREYQYRVVEAPITGYTTQSNGSYNILNIYTPGERDITVVKTWEKVNPNTDTVPTVIITLKRDGTEVQSVILNKDNKYTHTFSKLAKYAETGNEYVYTVEEVLGDGVEGYTKNIEPGNDGFTIINTFKDTKVDIKFTKAWEGIDEGSEVPDIKLHLYQNDVELTDKAVTLPGGVKANGQESYTFIDLPMYATDGTKYVYKVTEEPVTGYISSGDALVDENYTATITNKFDQGTTSISGVKNWKNVTDESKVPTITVKVQVSLDGKTWEDVEGKVKELSAGTTKYEFTGLPKYATDSTEYQYKVVEEAVNGYETSYGKNNVIINTYAPGERSIKVTKVWRNINLETDTVPKVMIVLKQDGTIIQNMILNSNNNYTHTFTKLARYSETGKEYVYTVEEVLPDGTVGYSKEITPNDEGYVIENIFDTTKIDVTFTKVWENVTDNSLVPNIYIDLYQDGNKYKDDSVMLKGGNIENRELTYVFKDLPKYSTEGKEYVYTIKEKPIMGYESTGEATVDANNNATITNTFTPGKVSVSGTKTWNMVDEEDLSSVPTIIVRLQSSTDGILWTDVEGKVVQLKAGELDFEFKDLPEYSVEGFKYKYKVVEDDVNGYKTLVDLKNNITNTYTPGTTAVKVTKEWTNVEPYIDEVPVVTINVMRDGDKIDSVELDDSNEYTHIFANLPKYAPTGELYDYTIEEALPDNLVGYEVKISLEENNAETVNVDDNEVQVEKSYIVENIFDNTTIDINFTKVWEGINTDSEVPEIKLHLYQDDKEFKTVTLAGGVKGEGKELYVFEDLPKYSTAGKEYTYKVVEEVPNGYISNGESAVDANNNSTITNKFDEGSVDVSGRKIWEDVSNEEIVPTITLTLESSLDGETWTAVPGKTLELEAKTTKYVFENLPKYSTDSREYQYRVVEDAVNGYETSYDDNNVIINTYSPGETSVKVTKKWTNVDPNTDVVPEVKIILKQDGIEVDSIVLDKDNNYAHIFENLDKYAPTGKEYVYTVEEVLADDVKGYTKEITSGEDGFVVENVFDTSSIDITFNKVWENVPEGLEVPSITLHLYQNGVEIEDKVATLDGGIKVNATENYVFEDLPKYSTDGTKYVYTIKEDSVNGYTSSGEANASNEYTITNTYDGGEKVVINGTKTWVNVENINKVPDITIRVLRDGEEIHNIVVPSGTRKYKVALDNMVKYAPDGHEYVYELTEDKIDGFESERDGYNFTNTKIIEEGVSGISDINIGNSNNINTGDNSMILLYASLAIISLSLISIIALRKRRKTIEK